MATSAYNELYLTDAMKSLSEAFDYAVNRCGENCDDFAKRFSECTAGIEFGKGNPAYVAGMSGIELARVVLEGVYAGEFPKPVFSFAKSSEYWAGWALAQYQCQSGLSFAEIFSNVSMSTIIAMYPTYHEMDVTRFYEAMVNCQCKARAN